VDVTVEGTPFTIEMFAYQTSPLGVSLKINGASTTPTVWLESGTYSLPGTTTKVLVNDVSVLQQGGAQGGTVTGSCQLFIGTSKLVFEEGMQVYKNDVVLTNTKVAIENTSTKIIKLEVQIGPDMDNNLKDGDSFTDPVWGTFKWNLDGMTPGATSDVREQIKIDRDGSNRVKLTFTNRDGNENGVDVLYGSGSTFTQTVDGTHNFHTSQYNSSEAGWQKIAIGDYFVISKDQRTRIMKYDTYYPAVGKEYVQFSDIGSGVIYKVYYKTDSFIRLGTQTHNVSYDSSSHNVAVDLSGADPGFTANATVSMWTREEARIDLDNPFINITESPLYTIGNDPTGEVISFLASYSAANGALFTTNISTHDVGTTFEDKAITDYGTFVDLLGDSVGIKNIVVYYPGKRPAYPNVAVGANPSIVVGEAAGGTVEQAVKITQPVAKFASEISDPSGITSDLILIGGPCANSLVATLMNTTAATCFTDWQAYDGGITEGIIKEFTDAFGSGQKALVVAGTNAADTRNMAAKVMQGTLDYQN
ncbi:MAG: S-layer protein, partial [Candidatus Aenigmatarchaeota archaeon]